MPKRIEIDLRGEEIVIKDYIPSAQQIANVKKHLKKKKTDVFQYDSTPKMIQYIKENWVATKDEYDLKGKLKCIH
jgi:hypothetical protein